MHLMTFDKQPDAQRTSVESKSNRSCNHHLTVAPALGLLSLPSFRGR